jgi:DNA-3-methyladenine glycosylase
VAAADVAAVTPGGSVLAREWFGRDARVVAPDLLNKVLAVRRAGAGWRSVRIVEVEAYDQTDPASHSYPRPTPRNAVMYGPPAYVYVYFSYGMHWCANIVTGPEGCGQALLLRAGEPLVGEEAMTAARAGVARRDLCRGPARLAQALGLTGADTGSSLLVGRRSGPAGTGSGGARLSRRAVGIAVLDDGIEPPAVPLVGPRVGITKAADVPWRWCVPGSPWVSSFRAGHLRRRT